MKYKPESDNSTFLGHYYGHDVWYIEHPTNAIVARYGNRGSEYASCDLRILKDTFNHDSHLVGLTDGSAVEHYDLFATGRCQDYQYAWYYGLLKMFLNES